MQTPRRVLVTGATGLVGAYVVAALLQEPTRFRVRALVRSPEKLRAALEPLGARIAEVEIATGDIADEKAVLAAAADCNAVVHAAGLFSNDVTDAERMRQTNVVGTRNVLAAARAAGADPAVHVSSHLALFPPRSMIQHADDAVTEPSSAYARTKADAERAAREFQQLGAPVVCIYPGSIYGPWDPTFGPGPGYLADAIRTRTMLVNRAGRVYIDVRDLAQVIVRALQPRLGPRRMMCGGNYVTDADIHAMLCKLTGRDIKAQKLPGWLVRTIGRAGDLQRLVTGRQPQLTYEAACVITRCVPCDDRAALALLGRPFADTRDSMHDLLLWMLRAGHLTPDEAGPRLVAELRAQQRGAA